MNSKKLFLLKPENYIGDKSGLFYGLVVSFILGVVGSFSDLALDGVLDLHQSTNFHLKDSFLMQFINWGCISFCLYFIAKLFGSKIRLIDIIGIFGTIKIWYIFPMILSFFLNPNYEVTEVMKGRVPFSLILMGLFSAVFSIIYIVYIFKAFKLNSYLTGWKLYFTFIIGVVLAEVLSKALIHFIL